jgi:transglutaminase superfamily protein
MMRLRSFHRRLHRLSQIDNGHRLLLAEAAVSLLVARLALKFVSFPSLARRFGPLVAPTDPRMLKLINAKPDQARIAKGVNWAVTRAAHYVPFRAVCLPQAIAAQSMLRRRGVASLMHFGVAREHGTKLRTHAWLDAAGVEVTGYPVSKRLAEIACFVCAESQQCRSERD